MGALEAAAMVAACTAARWALAADAAFLTASETLSASRS